MYHCLSVYIIKTVKINAIKVATNFKIKAIKIADLLMRANELLMTAIKIFILLICRLPQKSKQGV